MRGVFFLRGVSLLEAGGLLGEGREGKGKGGGGGAKVFRLSKEGGLYLLFFFPTLTFYSPARLTPEGEGDSISIPPGYLWNVAS